MKDCLERQIEWYQNLKIELENAAEFMGNYDDPEEQRLLEIVDQMETASKQNHVLEQEFAALKGEWDNSESILVEERNEIRAIGKKAQALSVELSNLYTKNGETAVRIALSKRVEMSTMRRLSNGLHKYRSDEDERDTLFNQKA